MIRSVFIALASLPLSLSAQLSGTVTINSANPTGGTNYQSFGALTASLASGITGPLVVNVITGSGPYNQRVTFNQVPGASPVNTITINGNGCLLTCSNSTNSSQPWTLGLNGTDYLHVN